MVAQHVGEVLANRNAGDSLARVYVGSQEEENTVDKTVADDIAVLTTLIDRFDRGRRQREVDRDAVEFLQLALQVPTCHSRVGALNFFFQCFRFVVEDLIEVGVAPEARAFDRVTELCEEWPPNSCQELMSIKR